MGRRPCCSKDEDLNKGAWTATEDKILTDYIKVHGEGQWRNLPKKAGLKRCGKSCRLRWLNYLRPDIKRGNITQDEDDLIVRLHKLLGNRWSLIAGRLPGRTDNEIKNYWNTNLSKKITQTSPISNHKPSNHFKEKTDDLPPSANTESYVVRTKATRCTKVFIPQIDTNPVGVSVRPSSAMVQQDLVLNDKTANQSEPFISMDDPFLTNLLDTDFSQFCGFDDGLQEDNKNTSTTDHGGLSYPNSHDPALLLSEEILHDPNFQSMASLLDSEMNWL